MHHSMVSPPSSPFGLHHCQSTSSSSGRAMAVHAPPANARRPTSFLVSFMSHHHPPRAPLSTATPSAESNPRSSISPPASARSRAPHLLHGEPLYLSSVISDSNRSPPASHRRHSRDPPSTAAHDLMAVHTPCVGMGTFSPKTLRCWKKIQTERKRSGYSIWLDSKLQLQSNSYLILEYFLWRKGYEYAISNHYDRHCVWEEVAQNKKLNKYNHTVIDQQFEFYQSDGLRRFDPADPKKLLPSNVPEGSLIVRAHTPMSNLFSCLWFNEVDHFTPRDQLSFAYTYLKLTRMNPGKTFHLNMFKDCERRMIVKLFRHRPEDKRNLPTQTAR